MSQLPEDTVAMVQLTLRPYRHGKGDIPPEAIQAMLRGETASPQCDRLATVDECAERLACSRVTVFRMIRRKQIRAVLLGPRSRRIPYSEIERIVAGKEAPQA
jgi:excisionase family DNA binding protein